MTNKSGLYIPKQKKTKAMRKPWKEGKSKTKPKRNDGKSKRVKKIDKKIKKLNKKKQSVDFYSELMGAQPLTKANTITFSDTGDLNRDTFKVISAMAEAAVMELAASQPGVFNQEFNTTTVDINPLGAKMYLVWAAFDRLRANGSLINQADLWTVFPEFSSAYKLPAAYAKLLEYMQPYSAKNGTKINFRTSLSTTLTNKPSVDFQNTSGTWAYPSWGEELKYTYVRNTSRQDVECAGGGIGAPTGGANNFVLLAERYSSLYNTQVSVAYGELKDNAPDASYYAVTFRANYVCPDRKFRTDVASFFNAFQTTVTTNDAVPFLGHVRPVQAPLLDTASSGTVTGWNPSTARTGLGHYHGLHVAYQICGKWIPGTVKKMLNKIELKSFLPTYRMFTFVGLSDYYETILDQLLSFYPSASASDIVGRLMVRVIYEYSVIASKINWFSLVPSFTYTPGGTATHQPLTLVGASTVNRSFSECSVNPAIQDFVREIGPVIWDGGLVIPFLKTYQGWYLWKKANFNVSVTGNSHDFYTGIFNSTSGTPIVADTFFQTIMKYNVLWNDLQFLATSTIDNTGYPYQFAPILQEAYNNMVVSGDGTTQDYDKKAHVPMDSITLGGPLMLTSVQYEIKDNPSYFLAPVSTLASITIGAGVIGSPLELHSGDVGRAHTYIYFPYDPNLPSALNLPYYTHYSYAYENGKSIGGMGAVYSTTIQPNFPKQVAYLAGDANLGISQAEASTHALTPTFSSLAKDSMNKMGTYLDFTVSKAVQQRALLPSPNVQHHSFLSKLWGFAKGAWKHVISPGLNVLTGGTSGMIEGGIGAAINTLKYLGSRKNGDKGLPNGQNRSLLASVPKQLMLEGPK